MKRCSWAEASKFEIAYHDAEWGVPSHDDTYLFEMLTLEGAQAGLSWSTILAKREGYREAFADFDVQKVARFTPAKVEKLVVNSEIVRHRGKIESTIANAKATLAIQEQHGTLSNFLWQIVDGSPVCNAWKQSGDIPTSTDTSTAVSKRLEHFTLAFSGVTSLSFGGSFREANFQE